MSKHNQKSSSVKPVVAPVAAKAPKAPSVIEKPAKKKKDKLPLRDRTTVIIGRQITKLQRLGKALASWKHPETDKAADYLIDAVESVQAALAHVHNLPADFTRKGAAAKRDLSAGAVVVIAEKRRAYYAGAIEAEDMLHLTVDKITNNGKTALCVQRDGLRQMIPTSHLRNAPAAAAETSEAAE